MSVPGWLVFGCTVAGVLWLGYTRLDASLRKFFVSALLVKLACGLLVGLLYSFVFTSGDTLWYHRDAAVLAQLAQTDFAAYARFLWMGGDAGPVTAQLTLLEPRALFFSRLVSIFCLLGNNNYWLVACWLSLLSFGGAWVLAVQLCRLFPSHRLVFLVALLFWPSVVFWSSGILKEAVALPALFLLVRVAIDFSTGQRPGWPLLAGAPVAGWLVWQLKYYWIGLAAPFLVFIALRGIKTGPVNARVVAFSLAAFAVLLSLHPNFYPSRILHVITENYYRFHYLTGGNNTFHFEGLAPTLPGLLVHAPGALLSGLFRPFLWECSNFFHVLAACENGLLLLLTMFMLLRFNLPAELRYWLVPLLVYALLECIFLSLATPAWGTLIRYRVGMLPFFVMFILAGNRVFTRWQRRLV